MEGLFEKLSLFIDRELGLIDQQIEYVTLRKVPTIIIFPNGSMVSEPAMVPVDEYDEMSTEEL